jgi:hypothetical protein
MDLAARADSENQSKNPRSGVPLAVRHQHSKLEARVSVSDNGSDQGPTRQFHYHLELSPAQLKITHTALRSLLDDFGHDEPEVLNVIHEVLDKLPDEHAIRAIQLDREVERQLTVVDGADDEHPPTAA